MSDTQLDAKVAAKLIARRVRVGGNSADSARLLADLIAAHKGVNLASALVYHGFAGEHYARLVADGKA